MSSYGPPPSCFCYRRPRFAQVFRQTLAALSPWGSGAKGAASTSSLRVTTTVRTRCPNQRREWLQRGARGFQRAGAAAGRDVQGSEGRAAGRRNLGRPKNGTVLERQASCERR